MWKIVPHQAPRKRRYTMSSLLLILPIIGLLAIFGIALRQDKGGKTIEYPALQDLI